MSDAAGRRWSPSAAAHRWGSSRLAGGSDEGRRRAGLVARASRPVGVAATALRGLDREPLPTLPLITAGTAPAGPVVLGVLVHHVVRSVVRDRRLLDAWMAAGDGPGI